MDCCFSTESMFTVAKRLNLTLEYAGEIGAVKENTNYEQAKSFVRGYLEDVSRF